MQSVNHMKRFKRNVVQTRTCRVLASEESPDGLVASSKEHHPSDFGLADCAEAEDVSAEDTNGRVGPSR